MRTAARATPFGAAAPGARRRRRSADDPRVGASAAPGLLVAADATPGRSPRRLVRVVSRAALELGPPPAPRVSDAPPPPGYAFDVVKTIRVPVPEPRRVARGQRLARSLERWIVAPGALWASSSPPTPWQRSRPWRIGSSGSPCWVGARRFDLTVLDPSRAATGGEWCARTRCGSGRVRPSVRRRRDADADASRESAAPGSTRWRSGPRLRAVRRARRGRRRRSAVRGTTAVCADLRPVARTSSGLPCDFLRPDRRHHRGVIDVVTNGAQERVQRAFEAWVEEGRRRWRARRGRTRRGDGR